MQIGGNWNSDIEINNKKNKLKKPHLVINILIKCAIKQILLMKTNKIYNRCNDATIYKLVKENIDCKEYNWIKFK
jgi:hypothetical protein